MSALKNYLSLIKFSHTIFAMPFALIGFFLAILKWDGASHLHVPGWQTSVIAPERIRVLGIKLLLVIFFARSAAMAFNRYLDRSFDAKNPRTAIREIPAGVISANRALGFTMLMCVLFIATAWFINPLCFYLSFIALAVVLGYSYTKRFTPLCHLVLGVGLSLAPMGAFLAVTGEFAVLPILFSFAVVFWVSGFDIIYALQDEEFDKQHQLYSIPSWLGKVRALRVSEVLHLFSAACILFAGYYGAFSWLYWVGAAGFVAMLVYQHSLVKPSDLSRVNLAFMAANGIASVVFAVFVISDLFFS
jgi:4-hydroxybenzoate polyprenyltransferase